MMLFLELLSFHVDLKTSNIKWNLVKSQDDNFFKFAFFFFFSFFGFLMISGLETRKITLKLIDKIEVFLKISFFLLHFCL